MSSKFPVEYSHIVMTNDRKEMMSTLAGYGYGVSLLKASGFYRLRLLGYGGEREISEIEKKFNHDAEKLDLEIIDYLEINKH